MPAGDGRLRIAPTRRQFHKLSVTDLESALINRHASINMDALSHGQVRSKLWLCEKIEDQFKSSPPLHLIFLGSWYGFLPFLILARGRLSVLAMDLIDVDSQAIQISKKILNTWHFEGLPISFHHGDANDLSFQQILRPQECLVVNTACEHFTSDRWLRALPATTNLCLQSTNMIHEEHVHVPISLEGFVHQVKPWVEVQSQDSHRFEYRNLSFDRYMVFGRKKASTPVRDS